MRVVVLLGWLVRATSGDAGSCPAGSVADPSGKCTASIATDSLRVPANASASHLSVQAALGGQEDLISQEIKTLTEFTELCQKKIALLQDLKQTIASGKDISLPPVYMQALLDKMPLMSNVITDPDKTPTGNPGDYLIEKKVLKAGKTPWDFVRFLPLRNPRTSSSSSTVQSTLPSTLLVAASADGEVQLFTPQGMQAQSFNAGHEKPLVHLSTSPSHDEYFIVTADSSGVIKSHTIKVRQLRLTKDQKTARRNSTDEKISQYLGLQVNVTVISDKQMQVPSGQISSVIAASQKGSKYFVASNKDGQVNIFSRNGTFRHAFDVTDAPNGIQGMFAFASNLIYWAGNDFGYLNIDKQTASKLDCPGLSKPIVAAVVDSQQTNRLLVSEVDGSVWAFNIKDKVECTLERAFPSGPAGRNVPMELGSIRGYIIALERAADFSTLVALNMSKPGPGTSAVVWKKNKGAVKAWHMYKRYQQGDLLAFLSSDGKSLEISEVLMSTYTPPSTDSFENFKLPVIAVAVVLVLGYQYMKQKGKGGGGRGGGFDSDAWKGLKKGGLGRGKFGGSKLGALGKRH